MLRADLQMFLWASRGGDARQPESFMRWPWQDPALQRYFAVFIVCTLAFLVGLWFKRKEERERREKPRPLEVKETYERHAVLQLKTIQDGMDKLLQSHAALEQKMELIHGQNEQTLLDHAEGMEAFSLLDARLKGTGDGLQVLLSSFRERMEERFDGKQKEEDVWRSHLLDRLPKLPKRKRK